LHVRGRFTGPDDTPPRRRAENGTPKLATPRPSVKPYPGLVASGTDLTSIPSRSNGRRRARRGREPRGPLIPPGLPAVRSRAALFDRHVEGATARLERSWAKEMKNLKITVEDVPMTDPASWEGGLVPLARAFGRHGGEPDRIVFYRRPIEERAADQAELALFVLDILVEQVAHLLGKRPEEIDPGYDD